MASDSLRTPGRYGIADDDPNVLLIDELGQVARDLGITPVVIGGMAVIAHGYKRTTQDVNLLLPRARALEFIRALERSASFTKIRLERFRHTPTGRTVDLCVEGERTSPHHSDTFPAPAAVDQLTRDPLPVVGLIDLLALKVKSSRALDEADFVQLTVALGLSPDDLEKVRQRIQDPRLRENLDRWHARALEEIEREKLRRPLRLE